VASKQQFTLLYNPDKSLEYYHTQTHQDNLTGRSWVW